MIRYIDAHCHLDLFPDYQQTARDAVASSTAVLTVTTLPRAWKQNREMARPFPNVIPALGLHPQLMGSHSTEIDLFEEFLPEAHFVGEVGLDATARFYPYFEQQKQVFGRILDACAACGDKILSVHSVRTAKTVLDMIADSHILNSECKVILHWFTGGMKEAQRGIELGCYFSINASMLEQPQHHEVIRGIPLQRLLTESDGPFSQALEGQQSPVTMPQVVEGLVGLRTEKAAEIQEAIVANFEHLRT